MNSGNEKERMDELFKKGLQNPDKPAAYQEEDWLDLEGMLNQHNKRGWIVRMMPLMAGIAAMLLLVLGWWFFKADEVKTDANNIAVKPKTEMPVNTPGKGNAGVNPATAGTTPATVPAGSTSGVKNNGAGTGSASGTATEPAVYAGTHLGKKHVVHATAIPGMLSNAGINGGNTVAKDVEPGINNNSNEAETLTAASVSKLMPDQSSVASDLGISSQDHAMINDRLNKSTGKLVAAANKAAALKAKAAGNKPQFALTVLASPDINGVSSFSNSKLGTNVGMLFSASLFKKFTITTGAVYAKKPYDAEFNSSYTSYTFKTQPTSVSADCRVLDIPINIAYQVYGNRKNKITVGSGLSSYFMLSEKYHYNYASTHYYGPSDYNITNRNKHILGVLNLDATYQRRLNSRFSLDLQPYLKIPLTKIGNSQVKLQSAGVAVGVSWNINTQH